MGGWLEAEHCQGSPESIRLHSTMQEQPTLICLWSWSGNPSQVERRQNWGNRWHSVLASGSPWPTCVQQGALLLPVGSFLIPGLYLSFQRGDLHSAELLRRCFGCLIQIQTTSGVHRDSYVYVDITLQILSPNRKIITKVQRVLV